MLKKICISIAIMAIIASLYTYSFAKYIQERIISIAEVNVEKTVVKKKYNIEVYYIDIGDNSSMKVHTKRLYQGSTYKFDILEFEGYTYLYTDGQLEGIVEGNTTIYCYYKMNE